MTPKWQKLASLAQEIRTLKFQFFGAVFAFKKIFIYNAMLEWQTVQTLIRSKFI